MKTDFNLQPDNGTSLDVSHQSCRGVCTQVTNRETVAQLVRGLRTFLACQSPILLGYPDAVCIWSFALGTTALNPSRDFGGKFSRFMRGDGDNSK